MHLLKGLSPVTIREALNIRRLGSVCSIRFDTIECFTTMKAPEQNEQRCVSERATFSSFLLQVWQDFLVT